MSISSLIIIGEIFIVLLGAAAYLFYYLNNLNNQLQHNYDVIKKKIKDEKRHSKGLKVTIQELKDKIKELEEALASNSQASKEIKKLEKSNKTTLNKLSQIEENLESEKQNSGSLSQQLKQAKNELKQAKQELEQANTDIENMRQEYQSQSPPAEEQAKDNFEEMYHDLKNAIAYNMSGGDQVLNTLRDRLKENGNIDEGEKLAELKEHYNSLGEMVGVVDQVVLFDSSETDHSQVDEDLEKIKNAENLVEDINETLDLANNLNQISESDFDTSQEQVKRLLKELDEVGKVKDRLKSDLNKTSEQLRAFIQKARMFQAQKEQIKMHKATQNQMHRNYVNLSGDFKQLSRKFKTLESRNEVLNAQLKNSSDDPEVLKKLDDLREQLEDKEKTMDRLVVEKEMIEQQFLSISEDSNVEAEASQALERLQSEHQLLEQQFLDVLTDLETGKTEKGA